MKLPNEHVFVYVCENCNQRIVLHLPLDIQARGHEIIIGLTDKNVDYIQKAMMAHILGSHPELAAI